MINTDKDRLRRKVIDVLKNVYDPEIPISVWDLGLIYELNIDDENVVHIKMTLTAPGCPIANFIVNHIADAIRNIEGVKDADIELVFDPPWDPTKMTKEGRKKFKEIYGYDIVEEFLRQKNIR
ncbi:MAG: FeS assembly SUF system protein [Desulfurococcales archaeon ex4484_42]|nr:MAG: FeS assembly SUF system protein [Desulfurococcales archaeon ex4484_42]